MANEVHLSSWACPANEGFSAVFVRPAGMDTDSALQLAWERALAAGVLFAQLEACTLREEKEKEIDSDWLAQLSRILAQINNCRLLLRAVQASTLPGERNSRGGSSRKAELETRRYFRRGHELISGTARFGELECVRGADGPQSGGTSPETKAVRLLPQKSVEVLTVHKDTLHDLLNRTVYLLNSRCVAKCLLSVLEEDAEQRGASYSPQGAENATDRCWFSDHWDFCPTHAIP